MPDMRSREGLAVIADALRRRNGQLQTDAVVLEDALVAAQQECASWRLVAGQLLAVLHSALHDPDQWPIRVVRLRDERHALAREAIDALFAGQATAERRAA